ncbi:M20 family metallopeptidase [Martelella alba]|uniref:M20 family metallopeptidase n=1 Tax=Martelella alba TaxID=2590451 RepID=A0ABY2SMY8_9HYPH|nr:M20 family metallopeptidase [Martelella alba]TKI07182.1 M20 family metallopeptidase [Martelella alba]
MHNKSLTELEQRVLARITEQRWLDLARELIRTGQPRSGNPLDPDLPGAEEEAIAMRVAGKFEALGMDVAIYEAVRHRPNVVGVLKGSGAGPSLMINDHLDTYPVVEPERWDKTGFDPYNATRHGDLLYGRGTSDTRGNMAACLLAAQVLKEEGVTFAGDLIYCFCVDEERNGTYGSLYLTQEIGIRADYSITAEPTAWGPADGEWGMNLSIANAGHCLLEVSVIGAKSHIWRPDISINPVVEAAAFIPALQNMAFTHQPTDFMGHTPPCVTIVRIQGGLEGEMQFSPGACVITLAVVGLVPGMTLESIIEDVNRQARQFLGERQDISITVRQVPDSLFVAPTTPVPLNEEPCLTISSSYRKLMNDVAPIPNRKNAFNDTIRLREAGINAVTIGPGEDGWAVDNESISISKAVMATRLYALTILGILKGAAGG